MPTINWEAEAQRAIEHVKSDLSEAHRGAFVWYDPMGIILLFDNRSSVDPVPQLEQDFVREVCKLDGSKIQAFLDDGETWIMLIQDWTDEQAFDCVWAAWHAAASQVVERFEPLDVQAYWEHGDLPLTRDSWFEYETAKMTIEAHFSNPNRWKNCVPNF